MPRWCVHCVAVADGRHGEHFFRPPSGKFSRRQEHIMKHRGVDFDVEEKPPSWWHWKLYPREGGQPVIANMKFQTRDAAVDACIIEINGLLDKGQNGGGAE
jgi:hypothetical protein